MEQKIKEILDDLYNFDPSLKEHEGKIIKIIEECQQALPNSGFNEEFAKNLKSQILKRIGELKEAERTEKSFASLSFLNFARKFTYGLAGAAAFLLVLILPLAVFYGRGGQQSADRLASRVKFNFEEKISKIADNGFGRLSGVNLSAQKEMGAAQSESAVKTAPSNLKDAAAKVESAIGFGGGGNLARSSLDIGIMPPFENISYEFVYEGEAISQDKERLPVYKRVKGFLAGSDLGRLLTSLNTGLVNLSKFSGAGITYINLAEDKEFGYIVSLDFQNSGISIYPNWQKWSRPDSACRDEACFENNRLKFADVPADEKIISTADDFLKNYGVNMSNYGQPYVQDYWRREYEKAIDKRFIYIPEEIQVVYPLVIAGQTVYDESGNPTGLYVGVNIRQNKVASVNVIAPASYESSDYAVVTDADKILAVAKQGGIYGYYQYGEGGKKVQVKLGTPQLALMRYYLYNNQTQSSDELFLPAFVFPVIGISDQSVYFDRKNIIVPIVEEILSENYYQIGIPKTMPSEEDKIVSSEGGDEIITPDEIVNSSSQPDSGLETKTEAEAKED